MVSKQLDDVLYGTLCCVYGMGVPTSVKSLAQAERVSLETMRRRLRQLHGLSLVSWSKSNRGEVFWKTAEKGHQAVLDGMPKHGKRRVGDTVEVRIHHGYLQRGGREATSWREAKVQSAGADGSVTIEKPRYWAWPLTFVRADVRKPVVRKLTGKTRGRGGPGGWV